MVATLYVFELTMKAFYCPQMYPSNLLCFQTEALDQTTYPPTPASNNLSSQYDSFVSFVTWHQKWTFTVLEWTSAKYNFFVTETWMSFISAYLVLCERIIVIQIYQTLSYLTDGSGKLTLYFLCDLLTFITIIEHNYRTSHNHACDLYTFIISTEQNDHI